MKIERLDTNKVKVTLSSVDLVDLNINVQMLKPNSPHLRGFLREIMERVHKETGFNPYNGQVFVEAVQKDDGIVLVVTKVSCHVHPPKVRVSSKNSRCTYRFSSFENLCKLFCAKPSEVFSNAALYEYMDKFYLVIPKNAVSGISEFSEQYNATVLNEYFLNEHGKCHAKNESLITLAEGVKKLE